MDKRHIIIIVGIIIFLIMLEVGVILGVYFKLKSNERDNINNRITDLSTNIILNMNDIFLELNNNLDKIAAVFRNNGNYIPRSNYTDLVQFNTSPIKSSVESYYYIAKINNNEIDTFNDFCDKYVKKGCYISETNSTTPPFSFPPVANRSVYHPYVYSEPILSAEVNTSLVGFDFSSFAATRFLLRQAQASINITGSRRTRLGRDIDGKPFSYGIILSKGAFINRTNPKLGEVFGYASGLANIHDIIDVAIDSFNADLNRNDIDFFVFDITQDGISNNKTFNFSLMYKENKEEYISIWFDDDMSIVDRDYMIVNNFTLANRQWKIYIKYLPDFINREKDNTPFVIALSVGAISLLLNVIVVVVVSIIFFINKQKIRLEQEKANVSNKRCIILLSINKIW
jgi:CHASE1-domain containing sensor protein